MLTVQNMDSKQIYNVSPDNGLFFSLSVEQQTCKRLREVKEKDALQKEEYHQLGGNNPKEHGERIDGSVANGRYIVSGAAVRERQGGWIGHASRQHAH